MEGQRAENPDCYATAKESEKNLKGIRVALFPGDSGTKRHIHRAYVQHTQAESQTGVHIPHTAPA